LIGPVIPARPLTAVIQFVLTIVVAIAAILAVTPHARGAGTPAVATPAQPLPLANVHSGTLL
jgi:hypothetical protein